MTLPMKPQDQTAHITQLQAQLDVANRQIASLQTEGTARTVLAIQAFANDICGDCNTPEQRWLDKQANRYCNTLTQKNDTK